MPGAMDMFGTQAYPGAPGMGSIYDYGPKNSFADPQAMALFGLAQGLFKAGGASPVPVGIGGALGQGIGGALSGAMGAQHMNQQQQLVDLEKSKADMTRQQLLQAQRQFQMQQGLLAQFGMGGDGAAPAATPPTQIASAGNVPIGAAPMAPAGSAGPAATPGASPFPLNPMQLAGLKLAGMPDLIPAYNASQPNVEVKDGVMYDKKSGQVIGTVPTMNPQGFSTQLKQDGKGGWTVGQTPGAIEAFMAQQRAGEKAKAERDLVTVPATAPNAPPTYRSRESLIPGGGGGGVPAGMSPAASSAQAADAAQQSEVAKNYGKIYNDLQNASMTNPVKIAKFQRIGSLLDGFEGGKLSKTGMDLAKLANSAGMKIDPKLPNKEAAEALTNEVALELRSTGSGNGMPGSMSDSDREFLKSMTPQMAQTNEGRKTIIDSRVKVMERENQVSDMARQYRKKYGKLDDDFFTQLQGWSSRNPIFKQ